MPEFLHGLPVIVYVLGGLGAFIVLGLAYIFVMAALFGDKYGS